MPKVTDKLCFPLKLAYQCYLKTIPKNKRPNAIDSVKAKVQKQSEVSTKCKKQVQRVTQPNLKVTLN